MITMVLRTVLVYLFLIIAIRLMGKRQIGELQLSELVITLLLSELAAHPITDPEIPLCNGIFPILILLSAEILLSFCTTKLPFLKKLLNGSPSLLIHRGQIDAKEFRRARLSIEEMIAELRRQGFGSPEEINYAVLEENGKISLIPKAEHAPVKTGDLNLQAADGGIAHLLISDGHFNRYNMDYTGWDKKKIRSILQRRGFRSEKDIFIMTVDDSEQVFIVERKKRKA